MSTQDWNVTRGVSARDTARADTLAEDEEYARAMPIEELMAMEFDGVMEAADGCPVEPDGVCPHGHRSPMLTLGII